MPTPDAAAAVGLHKEPLARVLALLDRDGEEARVIGGAVRNALMGVPVSEVDIATTAVPEEIVRRCADAGLKAVPTGIEHGTVTVVVQGAPFEVTSLREDIETYGRKAKVAFGRDWAADAKRRDFTINALSLSRDGKVHDYVNGMPDIAARRVRFVGEPKTRIAEDYLRILRFFRFHAAYGHGDLDSAGLHACIVGRDGLDALSRERVRMEFLKLLAAPRAAETLAVMSDTGILQNLLGGVGLVASFADMVAVEAVTGVPRDPLRGLGALAVYVSEDADRLRDRLRLTNAESARLQSMADGWWRVAPSQGPAAAKELLYRVGPARFADRVLLAWARSSAQAGDPGWRELAALPEHWAAPKFPLKAADFLTRGVERGPRLGRALADAEREWLAAGFPADDAAVASIADRVARNFSS